MLIPLFTFCCMFLLFGYTSEYVRKSFQDLSKKKMFLAKFWPVVLKLSESKNCDLTLRLNIV